MPATSDEDDIPSSDKKKKRFRHGKKISKKLSSSTGTFHDDVWGVTLSGKSKEEEDLSSLLSVWK